MTDGCHRRSQGGKARRRKGGVWLGSPHRGCHRRSPERKARPTGPARIRRPDCPITHEGFVAICATDGVVQRVRASRDGGGQVAASVLPPYGVTPVPFRTHGGLRRDRTPQRDQAQHQCQRESGGARRGQVLVQSSLSGVHGCLRIDHGLLASAAGGVSGCRRGRGAADPAFTGQARYYEERATRARSPFCQELALSVHHRQKPEALWLVLSALAAPSKPSYAGTRYRRSCEQDVGRAATT